MCIATENTMMYKIQWGYQAFHKSPISWLGLKILSRSNMTLNFTKIKNLASDLFRKIKISLFHIPEPNPAPYSYT